MPTQSRAQKSTRQGGRQQSAGQQGGRQQGGAGAALQSLFESPLFREALANALVAAAGAAAATLIRKNPGSATRVANVAAAATAMTATSSAQELTDAGRQAVRDLATRVGREVIPSFMSAVMGTESRSNGGGSDDEDEDDRPARRGSSGKSKAKAGADSWR
jgi:hypothetical protein